MKNNFLTRALMTLILTGTIAVTGSRYVNVSADTVVNSYNSAIEVALLETNGGEVIKFEQDYDFFTNVYDIEILNGKVKHYISLDTNDLSIYKHVKRNIYPSNSYTNLTISENDIGLEAAKDIALASTYGGEVVKLELDNKKGSKVYEFIILNNDIKYEIDVLSNGELYSYEEKAIYPSSNLSYDNKANTLSTDLISMEEAKQIALLKTGGGRVTELKLDYEKGIAVYEVEIKDGFVEYEIDIRASDGSIVKYDKDFDD